MSNIGASDADGSDASYDLLRGVLTADPPPFALIHRRGTGNGLVELIVGEVTESTSVMAMPLPGPGTGTSAPRVVAIVPYRQVTERGYECHDDGEPILVLSSAERADIPVEEIFRILPDVEVELSGGSFDVSDAAYARMVRRILEGEIRSGEGSNFVIRRSFRSEFTAYGPEVAMAVFRRLLAEECNAYWTFVVHTGERTFVGASPEQHVYVAGGMVQMSPISGTYRYRPTGPNLNGVLNFLGDQKETDELFMVLDEELKMMARICDADVQVHGPHLREMARLAHTEYRLTGRASLDVREVLRETMFAPTVIGSPLENACRVIARNELTGRGYYSGAIALLGSDDLGRPWLDSAILIRTAEIRRSGALRVDVGATLVRHSRPEAEVAETLAKTEALLAAVGVRSGTATVPASGGLAARPEVVTALHRRNDGLSSFWLVREDAEQVASPPLIGTALVADAEDMFTGMLAHQMRSLGLDVTIRPCGAVTIDQAAEFDFVVLGPGPGDPRDDADPRIARLNELVDGLLSHGVPLLAECLSHQLLAGRLGLPLVKRQVPNQGTQREIDLFGSAELVGFYNSYAARYTRDRLLSTPVGEKTEVCRDERTGEVHALRGPGFASTQFHMESVLTRRGVRVLAELLAWIAERPPKTGALELAEGEAHSWRAT